MKHAKQIRSTLVVGVASAMLTAVLLTGCASMQWLPSAAEGEAISATPSPTPAPTAEPTPEPTPEPTDVITTVQFSATGDNLIHLGIYSFAARTAASAGEGAAYDFSPSYENVATFYEQFDVNWINQETLINDAFEAATYPYFSTPIEMGYALYDIGFRVFSLSNNHTYDKGALGVASTLEFWDSMPDDVIDVGLWDEEAYDDIPIQEVDGVTIAYLAYTFSTNGIPEPSDTIARVIYTTELELIEYQVSLAKTLADFVIVGVHWGIEDSHTISTSQTSLAQRLTNCGADVIIGTHPHVLQDGEWLTAEDGSETFVIYSLGNFISTQSSAPNLIGGVLDITLQKTQAVDGTVTCEVLSPTVHITVTHYEWSKQNTRVYLYSDYTEELAATHGVRETDTRFSYSFIGETILANISEEFLAEDDAALLRAQGLL